MKTIFAFAIFLALSIRAHASPTGVLERTNFSNSRNEIYGYVCDGTNTNAQFSVSLYADGQLLAAIPATAQRPLSIACGANPFHGFVYTLPESLRNGVAHNVTATANPLSGGSSFPLTPSSLSVTLPTAHALKGFADFLNTDYYWGWACNPTFSAQNTPNMNVAFFKEDGTFLGTATPQILRESAVGAACGGSAWRAFEFIVPASVKDNQTHTIYAYAQNLDGSGRTLIGSGVLSNNFHARSIVPLAAQSNVTAANVDSTLTTTTDPYPAPSGGFAFVSNCFGPAADDGALSANVGQYTGFNPSTAVAPLSSWQRGITNTSGIVTAMQAQGTTVAMYANNIASYVDPICGGEAGATAQFAWELTGPVPAPRIWPTNDHASKSRELIVKFDLAVPTATNISYAGPSFLFRDVRNDKIFYLDVQAFDTRASTAVQSVLPTCAGCGGPIFFTSYGLSGNYNSYGRTVSGTFAHTASSQYVTYEYRINGYQLEPILQAIGCSDVGTTSFSCDSVNYRFSLAGVGMETITGAQLGLALRNLSISYSTN